MGHTVGAAGTDILYLPAPGKGQDRWIAGPSLVAVADGVTPLTAADADPGPFIEAFLRAVAEVHEQSIEEAVARALHRSRAAGVGAAWTFAVARSVGSSTQLAVLGDCAAIAQTRGGRVHIVEDRRPRLAERDAIEALRKRLTSGEPYAEAMSGVLPMLAEMRRRKNRAGTYWVATGQRNAARQMRTVVLPSDDVESILIATDGFLRLSTVFHDPTTLSELLSEARRVGLRPLSERLRRHERDDAIGVSFPRLSLEDDATAVLVSAL